MEIDAVAGIKEEGGTADDEDEEEEEEEEENERAAMEEEEEEEEGGTSAVSWGRDVRALDSCLLASSFPSLSSLLCSIIFSFGVGMR